MVGNDEDGIIEQIPRVQRKQRGRYGHGRMRPEVIEALGWCMGHMRIGRLMRERGLCHRLRRPFRAETTIRSFGRAERAGARFGRDGSEPEVAVRSDLGYSHRPCKMS